MCFTVRWSTLVMLIAAAGVVRAGDERRADDDEIVRAPSAAQITSLCTEAGYRDIEPVPIAEPGEIILKMRHDEETFMAFFFVKTGVLTLGTARREHAATLEKINAFNQSSTAHKATLTADGLAKLELNLELRDGVTKRTLRRAIAFFPAMAKVFRKDVCE
ncbi:MAG: YbjN domain-containing protein [Planctomycetaceae bacterium]|nr:YbjN domain-containing protein [Planctomycetaceae bacterium]